MVPTIGIRQNLYLLGEVLPIQELFSVESELWAAGFQYFSPLRKWGTDAQIRSRWPRGSMLLAIVSFFLDWGNLRFGSEFERLSLRKHEAQ